MLQKSLRDSVDQLKLWNVVKVVSKVITVNKNSENKKTTIC